MLDSCKMLQKQSEEFHTFLLHAFFPSLKQNVIAYRSSKVSSRPDCILKFTSCDNPYLPTPQLGQDMTQGQFFNQSLTGLNSEFSFS